MKATTAHNQPAEVTIRLEFEESSTVQFEQGSDGNMFVTVKGPELPMFPGQMFNQEFLDFLHEHKVGGVPMDTMYDGVMTSLRRGMAMELLMQRMK